MRSGVGIKNKVLEAWACARPVVMSQMATNGLIVPPDHAELVGDTPNAMADAVISLFNDPEQRHRLGSSARANVATNFTWAGAATRIDALLRR
jgi:glycosyltransferase involved in cell wall biosynthesis